MVTNSGLDTKGLSLRYTTNNRDQGSRAPSEFKRPSKASFVYLFCWQGPRGFGLIVTKRLPYFQKFYQLSRQDRLDALKAFGIWVLSLEPGALLTDLERLLTKLFGLPWWGGG